MFHNSMAMSEPLPPKDQQGLMQVAKLGTALSFGALTGSLWAMDAGPTGLRFKFSAGVMVAALVGVVVAFVYWRLLQKMIATDEKSTAAGTDGKDSVDYKKFVGFTILLFVATLLAFLYPLRYAPSEKHQDIAFGMVLAFACIAGVARVVWWLKKVLDEDDQQNRR